MNVQQISSTVRRLTISTKALVSAIVAGTSLLQVQQLRDFAIKLTLKHPHVSSILIGAAGVLTVLHNPQVQKFLHIEQQTQIPLAGGGTATINTDTTANVG